MNIKYCVLHVCVFEMYNFQTEALYDGLVGHWELADTTLPPCSGIDHNGADWVVEQAQVLSGIMVAYNYASASLAIRWYIQTIY